MDQLLQLLRHRLWMFCQSAPGGAPRFPVNSSFHTPFRYSLCQFLVPAALAAGAYCLPAVAAQPPTERYAAYLRTSPAVTSAIGLQGAEEESSVFQMAANLDATGKLPVAMPVGASQSLAPRTIHLRHAAFALWVEVNKKVPWRLAAYSRDDLNTLLAFDATLTPRPTSQYLMFMTDMDQLFNQGRWIRPTRRETIFAIGEWFRTNVTHGSYTVRDGKREPSAPKPQNVADYLAGGQWSSCHITGDFVAAVSASLNIPCRTAVYPADFRDWAGHRNLDFPADDQYLVHGDDFYSGMKRHVLMEKVFASGPVRRRIIDLKETNPGSLFQTTTQRDIFLYLQYGRDPELINAAKTGPDAVYALLDKQTGMTGANGKHISRVEPIRAEVLNLINMHLANIRLRPVATPPLPRRPVKSN
jgi:hypothetical protein